VGDLYCSFTSNTDRACKQLCSAGTEFLALKKFSTSCGWWCYNWRLSYITVLTIFRERVVSHISPEVHLVLYEILGYTGFGFGIQQSQAPVAYPRRVTALQHCHVFNTGSIAIISELKMSLMRNPTGTTSPSSVTLLWPWFLSRRRCRWPWLPGISERLPDSRMDHGTTQCERNIDATM
jgi:hypothetical protein